MQLGFAKTETYLFYVTLVPKVIKMQCLNFSSNCRCLVTDEGLSRKWLI